MNAMMVVATLQSAICSSGQCSRNAHWWCIIDNLVLFLKHMLQNKWLVPYVCVYLPKKNVFMLMCDVLFVWPDRRSTAYDICIHLDKNMSQMANTFLCEHTRLNVWNWSLTGLAVPSPTCCLSPVYWLDRADHTLTGWEQTMLMTSSTCLATPSAHQRSMGTDKEILLAIWLRTGLTLPELGKTLLYFNGLRKMTKLMDTFPHCSVCSDFHRDPNTGNMKVPVTWPEYSSTGQQFLDIHAKMDESSVGQEMRLNFVKLWTETLPSLPSHAATDVQWCKFSEK